MNKYKITLIIEADDIDDIACKINNNIYTEIISIVKVEE